MSWHYIYFLYPGIQTENPRFKNIILGRVTFSWIFFPGIQIGKPRIKTILFGRGIESTAEKRDGWVEFQILLIGLP